MVTISLKGIWGLEQLDGTGIATWKLSVLLMGGGALFGAMLIPILGEVNPDSVFVSPSTQRMVPLVLVSFPFLIGFILFWSIVLARTTENDLRLLASIDERALRRWRELVNNGNHIELEEVKKQMAIRDEQDSTRDISPLHPAPDAVIINTTVIPASDVVQTIVETVMGA